MKKKKKPSLKKIQKKELIKESDKTESMWKLAAKARDNNTCQAQGLFNITCDSVLQVHHAIVGRRHKSTFFEINNALTLCKSHHANVTFEESGHVQKAFTDIVIAKIGQEEFDRIARLSKQIVKRTISDFLIIRNKLEQELYKHEED